MYAAMAQLVEHILGKDEVPGPNPGSSSRQPRRETFGALVFYRLLQTSVGAFFFGGCPELLPHTSSRDLCRRRRYGPHTLLEDRRVYSPGAEYGYLRFSEYPGSSRLLAAARSLLGSDSHLDCHSTPRSRFATPKGNLRGFGFI